ncbi:MAG: cytochrome-c oxidase, cbb3-type subunit III [Alphaproteobacteria bacterium]|jgi:cytochrome c oxidase cbb3-type subunit 3|nr:cytochrome-c oxidase, cbb3-type subunit III [Alphaproteobacteria bacterium]QQS57504.1 MAG: cytochrome-c oxidase, cbb3-type subunit III [Alphaproteobacteria bacterium]
MSDAKKGHTPPKKEIDSVSGVETTGHDWDGIKELNNPAPRWWLWVFYICVIWSIWYWVVYPAWPTLSGATEGTYGWTQYKKLAAEQQEIVDRQKAYLEKFEKASFDEIFEDEQLYAFAMAGGSAFFKDNCATCHGTGGMGGKGYPNLNDDDWLWGGDIESIYQTIQFGVRSKHDDTRVSQMPAFGVEDLLNKEEIEKVVDYVLSLSDPQNAAGKDFTEAQGIFEQNCASCHGEDAKGLREFGAPNLVDSIWLYGGDRESVFNTVFYARAGMMPNWVGRLDENTIRQLAVYVHELGGGETGKTVQAAPVEVPEAVPQEEPVVSGPEKQGQNELVPPTVPVETEVAPSEGAEVNPVKAMETLPAVDNTETSGHDGE